MPIYLRYIYMHMYMYICIYCIIKCLCVPGYPQTHCNPPHHAWLSGVTYKAIGARKVAVLLKQHTLSNLFSPSYLLQIVGQKGMVIGVLGEGAVEGLGTHL